MNLLLDAGVTSIPEHKRCEGSLVPLRDCGENVHQKPIWSLAVSLPLYQPKSPT